MGEIQEQVSQVKHWRHRIQLPNGQHTPGFIDTEQEWARMNIPKNLSEKRVLDIGCSDGYYSFKSESLGASYVLAIDDKSSLLWQEEGNGFTAVKEILRSKVEFKHLSVYDLSVTTEGMFDLVFFLNVLYHLKHPILALEKIRSVMPVGGVMIYKSYFSTNVEFKIFNKPFRYQLGNKPMARFYPTNELSGDFTNWWGPNIPAHRQMIEAAGFKIAHELYRSYDRIYYTCKAV